MNLIICALLVSGLCINTISGGILLNRFNYDIKPYLANQTSEGKSVLGSSPDSLIFFDGGKISEDNFTIVWKARYQKSGSNVVDVSVRLSTSKFLQQQEDNALKALNAHTDPNIESYHIPRVYYMGKIFTFTDAMAITLYDGNLNDLYKHYKGQISELQILDIFKQAVYALKYLQSKKVVHNGIEPQRIFLRGSTVFIGDFDRAIMAGQKTLRCSKLFAPSSSYDTSIHKNRCAFDDLEGLVFSIWYIAGIPLGESNGNVQETEGKALFNAMMAGTATERVLEKCKHFKNPMVFKAFRAICVCEMLLKWKQVPNYDQILKILDEVIVEVGKKSKSVQFHWLNNASGSGSV